MATTTARPLNLLITGGGRGIGRGLSRHFLNQGHRVFLVDSNAEELNHTHKTLTSASAPNSCTALTCDLRNLPDIEKIANAASDFFSGRLDALINNAAYTFAVGGTTLESPDFMEHWAASVETNLTAPVALSRACLPMLRKAAGREHGGAIINMSSTRARQSEADSEGYAATKAGLIGLTHSMAVSLAPVGITVNAVLPGWINVENESKGADEKGTAWEEGLTEEDHEWHLSGRVGKVEDICKAVEYLIGARFVTGTETVVDGGVSRKMVYPE